MFPDFIGNSGLKKYQLSIAACMLPYKTGNNAGI
jgi:hypothetical protein